MLGGAVHSTSANETSELVTVIFMVPVNTLPGSTRLRVRNRVVSCFGSSLVLLTRKHMLYGPYQTPHHHLYFCVEQQS